MSAQDLSNYLHHQDMRIRQKAQFELATRGKKGHKELAAATVQTENQLARVHGIWGVGQIARIENLEYAKVLVPLLTDSDPEIVTQAVKILGDIRYTEAAAELVPLLQHTSLRVQLHAAEALGRMAYQQAFDPIVNMLASNNDEDIWLRHAGMIALSRMDMEDQLIALNEHESTSVRTAAVVALRRIKSPKISVYLKDEEESIVTETARAINDDLGITEALSELASLLNQSTYQNQALIRRSINANQRVGKDQNVDILLQYAQNDTAPADLRAEAIKTLSTWSNPSVYDRVDGRYLGVVERDDSYLKQQLETRLTSLLADNETEVQLEAANLAGNLQLKHAEQTLAGMVRSHEDPEVRSASLNSLFEMGSVLLNQALTAAFKDLNSEVRSAALAILPGSDMPEAQSIGLFKQVMVSGSFSEQQTALTALGEMQQTAAISALMEYFEWLKTGKAIPEIRLDITEAIRSQGNEELVAELDTYEANKSTGDPIDPFMETLSGGNSDRGQDIFYTHQAAQCVRCHTIFETGGTMGPGLSGVGGRLSTEELLRALIDPSGSFAEGYQMVTLELQDGETITGIVQDETDQILSIKAGNQETREISKESITKKTSIPSSMPPMGQILTKKELRDVLAFLGTLKGH
jgi:putative heme-binding domain-containing protein